MTKDGKTKIILAAMCAAGVILLIVPMFFAGNGEETDRENTEAYYYTEYLEGRVKKLCESVEGAGNVEVLLTLECSSEYVYSDEMRDFLVLSSGEEAVMLYEIYPRVRGVAISCTGGERADLKEKLTSLLSSALGISSNRITVVGGR